MKTEVLLIVESPTQLSPREDSVRERLEDVLHYRVSVEGPACNVADYKTAGLVIACAKSVPGELWRAEIPVLVCNVDALRDLGMVKGNSDFGTQRYSTANIGPEAIGEPLPAELTGRQPLTDEQAAQGWAKPGPNALVLATVGGDTTKAVAFAFDKGERMWGLAAPHRRGAFLATGNSRAQLKSTGWQLFDLAVKGVAEGGKWGGHPGAAGLWFLKDGTPTRSLSAGEYRDWAHDQIEKRVWGRVWKLLSALGVGSLATVVGVFALYWKWDATQHEKTTEDIKARLITDMHNLADARGQQIETRLETRFEKAESSLTAKTGERMADLLFNPNSHMGAAVQKQLERTGKDKVADLIKNDPAVRNQLLDAARRGLEQNGKTAEQLLELYQDQAKMKNAAKRRQTLRLIYVYAADEHQEKVRQLIRDTILNLEEEDSVRAAALEIFQPPDNDADARKELTKVLNACDLNGVSADFKRSLGTFITSFSDVHADAILDWLEQSDKLFTPTAADLLKSIAKLKRKDDGNPKVFGHLLTQVISPNKAKSKWGIIALNSLAEDPGKVAFVPSATKTREEAIDKLLNEINMRALTRSDFPVRAPLMSLVGPGLSDKYLQKRIGSGPRAASPAVQELLASYAARLKSEKQKAVPRPIVDQLLQVTDLLDGYGTAELMQHALEFGEPEVAHAFLAKLPLLQTAKKPGLLAPENPQEVVDAAIESDARSTPPFQGTIKMWQLLPSEEKKEEASSVRENIRRALDTYAVASQRQFEDLANLRKVLDRIGPAGDQDLFGLFARALDRANDHVIRESIASGKWDYALKIYAKLGQVFPRDPEWPFQRGKLSLDKRHQYQEAITEITAAIDLNPPKIKPAYYLTRGMAYRKLQGKADDAIADYNAALRLSEQGGLDDPENRRERATERATIHKKLALAHILKNANDPVSAKRNSDLVKFHIDKAVALYETPKEKADASENLGILYLTMEEWQLAFDNTVDAGNIYSETPWNWIVRYIAASQLKRKDAGATYQAWNRMGQPNDLANLYDYIPRLLTEHLGVVRVIDDRLQGNANMRTDFGESIGKAHSLLFKAGKKYVIDMESTVVDSYLLLQDSKRKIVAEDDDSGGGRNARIEFTADQDGDYTIIATSFGGQAQGAYALIIRELPGEDNIRVALP